MFATIAKFFLGGGLNNIAKELGDAYEAKLRAQTDKEKLVADQRIAQVQARAEVQKSESWSRVNAFVRAAFAAPVVIVFWKIYVYDKALGQWTGGTTDALSPELWWNIRVILGFYFLYEVTNLIKR